MIENSLIVKEPGLLTTVQDLGRPGLARYGVAPGGALDRAALILGNRLVGNDPGAAGLEITLLGPRLGFTDDTVVALTGADLGATLDDTPMPTWEPVRLHSGSELAFSPPAGGPGARAYVCVAGGLDVEPVMGSRSTDLFAGFGGWQGRALAAGAVLSWGEPAGPPAALLKRRLAAPPPAIASEVTARVVLGPQADRFTAAGITAFLGGAYVVTGQSDRMGMRLSGPPITHTRGADLISEGIAHGAIQVPGDGQPIVLLAARQTVGGYPKIATVVGADLDALAQLRPGDTIRFAAVEPDEARSLTLAHRAALGEDAVVTAPGADEGRTNVAEAWDPAGVAGVVAALREAGVTSFRLEVAVAGLDLKLELRRGPDGDVVPIEAMPAAATAAAAVSHQGDEDLITAPLLGLFYRRAAPDQAPLAEVGQHVEAGQALGLLEVMKTYHEVTAPRAGIVAEFLVEDGQFVEYGELIARLESVGAEDPEAP